MNKLVGRSKLFLNRNASTILTCIGGAGVVVTSILAVKATPKALRLLESAEEEKGEKLTKLETVKVAGPVYIPAVVTGVSTIACIFGANVLNKRQQAALASAYALVDSSYKEYKNKVKELYGEEADTKIREEIVKDECEEIDIPDDNDGKQLFFDCFSNRYFRSTMEKVLDAEYQINRELVMKDYAYLNEFYEFLDIEPIESGYRLGWSNGACFTHYWQTWLDFGHEKVTTDDGLECTIITMYSEPIIDFETYC